MVMPLGVVVVVVVVVGDVDGDVFFVGVVEVP